MQHRKEPVPPHLPSEPEEVETPRILEMHGADGPARTQASGPLPKVTIPAEVPNISEDRRSPASRLSRISKESEEYETKAINRWIDLAKRLFDKDPGNEDKAS